MGQILTGQEKALANVIKALLQASEHRINLTREEKNAKADAIAALEEMGVAL